MTVVVAFYCQDGVVVASDSMITPSIGGINVGHHHGKKVEVLSGPQIFAFAGDQGQGARFKICADLNAQTIATKAHALDYGLAISIGMISQFASTGIPVDKIGTNTFLAFAHSDQHHCCVFEGHLQPRLLDRNHCYAALGSGKLSADPFLRFLNDVFLKGAQPTVSDALFIAVWTVQHVIDTNPGGVAGPIQVAVLGRDSAGVFEARELANPEISEHQQAVESAAEALRSWRHDLQFGSTPATVLALPKPPAIPPAASSGIIAD